MKMYAPLLSDCFGMCCLNSIACPLAVYIRLRFANAPLIPGCEKNVYLLQHCSSWRQVICPDHSHFPQRLRPGHCQSFRLFLQFSNHQCLCQLGTWSNRKSIWAEGTLRTEVSILQGGGANSLLYKTYNGREKTSSINDIFTLIIEIYLLLKFVII